MRDGDDQADKDVNTPVDSKRRNSKAQQSDVEGDNETLIIDASGSPVRHTALAEQLVYDRNTMRNSLEQQ